MAKKKAKTDKDTTDVKVTENKSISKKAKQDPEDKEFLSWVKRYFTSISARRTPYVFFNLLENKNSIVMINSDGALFLTYCVPDLSIHIVTLKEEESAYLQRLKELLQVGDTSVLRHLPNWMSHINAVGLVQTRLWTDASCGWLIATTEEYGEKEYDKRKVVGYDTLDFQITQRIVDAVAVATQIYSRTDRYLTYPAQLDCQCTGCVLFEKVDLQSADIVGRMADYADAVSLQHINFDGLSCPSHKEFVGKTKGSYTYERKLAFETAHYLRAVTYFEDDQVTVLSFRPNNGTYVLYNTLSAETK